MRDPLAKITIQGDTVRRFLYTPLCSESVLRHDVIKRMVQDGKLVPFSISPDFSFIDSELIPFVVYPYEWCDAQLLDAATLTLDISNKLYVIGYQLKDASAWNIVFEGQKPIFVDLMSFEKIFDRTWRAFGQYIRNFVLPLALSKYRGLKSFNLFKFNRDGIDPKDAKNIFGIRRFVTFLWPLMLGTNTSKIPKPIDYSITRKDSYHSNLYALCRYFVRSLAAGYSDSTWSKYTHNLNHYSGDAESQKRQIVSSWIETICPEWTIDLGCNIGEYVEIAAKYSKNVIAIDNDHDSIQLLYKRSFKCVVYPLIAELDDIIGGRGWKSTEYLGLLERLKSKGDLVLILALIHHLLIRSSIPLREIYNLLHHVSKRHVILELVGPEDSMLIDLCVQYNRNPNDFSVERQLAELDGLFKIQKQHKITGTDRTLLLMTKVYE